MVGAPPDNIRAKRLAKGGVSTGGAGSADRRPITVIAKEATVHAKEVEI
jgi:hypothetical protein